MSISRLVVALGVAVVMGLAQSGRAAEPGPVDKDAPKEFTTTKSGLKFRIRRKSDGAKPKATDTVTVTVGNRAPTVQLAATPTSGKSPLTVSFTATGSDPDGDALTYSYDFGDGSKATGRTVSHKYTKVGTYTAKVTATDTSGATATAQVVITVTKK